MNTLLSILLLASGLAMTASAADSSRFRIDRTWEVARVPAGFPVGFSLLTHGDRQYVAYYDEQRRMTVAARDLDDDTWQRQVLPSRIGWDSHNYITMAIDDAGHLHVTGNMHGDPLVYFRTTKAGDIGSLEANAMTGELEARVTYPRFLKDAQERLVFMYRDGGSGRGNNLFNVYDTSTRTWSRLLEVPLLDGEGQRNAYPRGPTRGPDGRFHLLWVWRDTPDCATNHHLSYARSKDLVEWESAFGASLKIPILLETEATWVDPAPPRSGMINGGQHLFIDAKNRPVVTYHKADENGNMQVYAARAEGGQWVRRPLTEWTHRVDFSGNGSMGFVGIRMEPLERVKPGVLTMTYRHRALGGGRLVLDEETLQPVDRSVRKPREWPKKLGQVQGDFEGLQMRQASDIGDAGDPSVRYLLQWETLPAHRDRPRQPPLPPPSTLRLIKLVER